MKDQALADPERVVVRGGTLAFWRRGHPQWEAAKIMNDAIAMFCADRLRAGDAPAASPSIRP